MEEKAKLASKLRDSLASAISNYSAYNVPDLCARIGLSEGEEREAFNGKYRYAQRRLSKLRPDQVMDVAREFLTEQDSFEVAELVSKIDEFDRTHVSELTRRRIVGSLEWPLTSEIDLMEFIRKVWPIQEIPSPYQGEFGSESNLEDEIFRHVIRNEDWSIQELLENLGVIKCSQKQFFKFLTELVDPIAQHSEVQSKLVTLINEQLRLDGYELSVKRLMSGSPLYHVTTSRIGAPSDNDISAALQEFNPDRVWDRWEAARERRGKDPEGAITLARTLLEDVCKWILHEENAEFDEKDDLPKLYKKLANALNLAPDQHTEKSFKQILGSCQQIVEQLGSLRSKLGDAHSSGPRRVRPSPRHAELAVNLSGTMATFLVATWRVRMSELNLKKEAE